MVRLASIGNVLSRLLLLPGDLACDACGLGHADNRHLIRMLVNSLAWALVGIVVVVISV